MPLPVGQMPPDSVLMDATSPASLTVSYVVLSRPKSPYFLFIYFFGPGGKTERGKDQTHTSQMPKHEGT